MIDCEYHCLKQKRLLFTFRKHSSGDKIESCPKKFQRYKDPDFFFFIQLVIVSRLSSRQLRPRDLGVSNNWLAAKLPCTHKSFGGKTLKESKYLLQETVSRQNLFLKCYFYFDCYLTVWDIATWICIKKVIQFVIPICLSSWWCTQ